MAVAVEQAQYSSKTRGETVAGILAAISVSHLLNDTIQSLIPSIYPILKSSFALTFSQIGLIALTLQLTASLLQPVVGMYTDRRPITARRRSGSTTRLARRASSSCRS